MSKPVLTHEQRNDIWRLAEDLAKRRMRAYVAHKSGYNGRESERNAKGKLAAAVHSLKTYIGIIQ